MAFVSTANLKRPQDFDQLEGQDFAVATLSNSIISGNFSHAYLFAGPRGVGKTTSARLLAKALNCEKGPAVHPCNECASCRAITASSSFDCVEIDGASNTSVDDVRKIRSDIMYPPSSRFKIYIIDEVHMLSNSAFNALLKTIEEPPNYVVFIFATTEIQKVPQTVRSRCQFFRFKPLQSATIRRRIEQVCSERGIRIDEESLSYIVRESEGSMRDAYTIFDQLTSFCRDDISFDKISDELLLTPFDSIADILACGALEDVKGALDIFFRLIASGIRTEQFINDFTLFVRGMFLFKSGISDSDALYADKRLFERPEFADLTVDSLGLVLEDLFRLHRDMRYSVNPRFECEVFLANLSKVRSRLSNLEIAKRLMRYEHSCRKRDEVDGRDLVGMSSKRPGSHETESVEPKRFESEAHAKAHVDGEGGGIKAFLSVFKDDLI